MMLSDNLILLLRVAGPLAASIFAYFFYCWTNRRLRHLAQIDTLLYVTYIASRITIWLIFAIFLQYHVSASDPRLFYVPMLEHFLAGHIPIRDFFYPYGPLLIPSILPFYVLLRHTLAGISLYAILAEGVALFFFAKTISLMMQRGEIDKHWPRRAIALYLLNPTTLYWTVFQGYNSITQTAYAMAAFYFLLRGYSKLGYGIGFYSVAGAKLLGILDWPGLLAVCRPRFGKLLFGAMPLLLTYAVYQAVTGDIFFPIRFHVGYTGEGNVWFLTTAFGRLHGFYSSFPGNLLPLLFFGVPFGMGFLFWMRSVTSGSTSFSFESAMGMTTFTMSLFFLFSLYSPSYYVPMVMLPAAAVVTYPGVRSPWTPALLLLISGFCMSGDAIWAWLGQRDALISSFSTSYTRNALASFWIFAMLVRIVCFAKLAQLGLRLATKGPGSRSHSVPCHDLSTPAQYSTASQL
jgi:hypothetical protein